MSVGIKLIPMAACNAASQICADGKVRHATASVTGRNRSIRNGPGQLSDMPEKFVGRGRKAAPLERQVWRSRYCAGWRIRIRNDFRIAAVRNLRMSETNIVLAFAVVANAFLISLVVVSAIEALRLRRAHGGQKDIPTLLPAPSWCDHAS